MICLSSAVKVALRAAAIAATLAAGSVLTGAANTGNAAEGAMGGVAMDARGKPTLPPKRDPEVAVREEYDAAVAAGTADALSLFVARHAGHALAGEAQGRLDALRGRPGTR